MTALKILRVETNPMYPHEAAARLRMIAKQLSKISLDEEVEYPTGDTVWTFKLPENDRPIGGR